MALLKSKEIRELSPHQIDEKLSDLGIDLAKMKSQKRSGGAPENTGKMREIKRTIARLLTIKTEKEKGIGAKLVKPGKSANEPKAEKPKEKKAEKAEKKPEAKPVKKAVAAPKKPGQKK